MVRPAPAPPACCTSLAALALLLLLCVLQSGCRRKDAKEAPAPPEAGVAPVRIFYPAAPGSFVRLVERVGPALVQLRAREPVQGGPADWLPEPAGPAPLPGGEDEEELKRSLGTGFLIDDAGTILTSEHLVPAEREILVRLASGEELPAKVVARDEGSGVGVLRVTLPAGARVTAARLGDSNQLKAGEWIVALGNAFGSGATVSAGIVGSRERPDLPPGRQRYRGFLQVDAAIHPGNSGGPLVNMAGEVVGICAVPQPQTPGTGFAVPITLVKRLLPTLRREGRVVPVFVGIYIERLTEEAARKAGLKNGGGGIITAVVPSGPAARAGLRAGDFLLTFDKKVISRPAELPWLAALAGADRAVNVTVWRAGARHTFTVRPERIPD